MCKDLLKIIDESAKVETNYRENQEIFQYL